jgi:hypothetical protein
LICKDNPVGIVIKTGVQPVAAGFNFAQVAVLKAKAWQL